VMTEIGETSARNKADIAGADHGDAHENSASNNAIGEMTKCPRSDPAPLAGFTYGPASPTDDCPARHAARPG
jgi:hypothetical protein